MSEYQFDKNESQENQDKNKYNQTFFLVGFLRLVGTWLQSTSLFLVRPFSNNCDCQLCDDTFIVESKRKSLNKNATNSFPLDT